MFSRICLIALAVSLTITFQTSFVSASGLALNYVILENNGSPLDMIDLVFIGHGYTQNELSKFASDVEMHVNFLFSIEPFRSYRSAFNIYRVDSTIDLEAKRPDPNAPHLLVVNYDVVFEILDNLGLMYRASREYPPLPSI